MSTRKSTPLTVLDVKRHSSGTLADAHPNRGLRLVANKNGTKTWFYRYRSTTDSYTDKQGKAQFRLKQIKLGNFPAMGLGEARNAFQEQKGIRDDVTKGDPRLVQEDEQAKIRKKSERAKEARYTVAHLIEEYLIEHIELARALKGQLEARRMMERDVIPALGNMSARDVRRSQIHQLIQKIATRAPRIAQMVKTELNGAFEHAIKAGRLSDDFSNPTLGVKAPKQVRRSRAFTDAELATFQAWLLTSELSQSIKDALTLMLLTGCRGGEVVSAEWDHIDLDRGEWRIPKTKNGLSHTVYLSRQSAYLLKERLGVHNRFVFPSPNKKGYSIRQHALVWGISRHRGNSGLAHWTSHDLRRSVGTGLGRIHCPRVVQDRILNHVDTSIAGIYDRHGYDDEARKWWQIWADHLDAINKERKPESNLHGNLGVEGI